MPTVNIHGLRDKQQLKAWLRAGKTVELRGRDKVIAYIVPAVPLARPRQIPDFAAMRREIFGDCVLPGADLLIKERQPSRY